MMAWIAWAAALSLAVTLAALAAEAALRLFARPTRWVWAAALALSLAAPFILTRPTAVARTGGMEMGTMDGPPPIAPAPSPVVSIDGAAPGRSAPGMALRARVDGALPYFWLAASLAMAAGLAGASLALRRRRRAWRPAVVGGAEVLISERMGPAVVGFIDSDIVLPRWTLGWAAPLQRLIVRHEREHIDAGDPLLLLFALLAVAAAPWNPALWWQLRRLRLALEVDCDARILRREPDVGAYGRLLLEVGRLAGGARIPVTAFSEPRSFLERRIRIMTASTPRNRAARVAALAAVLVGAGTLAAALPVPARPALAFAQVVQLDTTPTAAERRAREEAAADRARARTEEEAARRAREEAAPGRVRAPGEAEAERRAREEAAADRVRAQGEEEAARRARAEAGLSHGRTRSDDVRASRVDREHARVAHELAERQAELAVELAERQAASGDALARQQVELAERQARSADNLAQREIEMAQRLAATVVAQERIQARSVDAQARRQAEQAARQARATDVLAQRRAEQRVAREALTERQARLRTETDQARVRREVVLREHERSADVARSALVRAERELTVEGELRARVVEALERYQPRYAREGTAPGEFVYFLEDRAGNVRGAGVTRIRNSGATTTDALEAMVRREHPNLRVRDSYQWVGLRVREGGPRVNVAWVTVEN